MVPDLEPGTNNLMKMKHRLKWSDEIYNSPSRQNLRWSKGSPAGVVLGPTGFHGLKAHLCSTVDPDTDGAFCSDSAFLLSVYRRDVTVPPDIVGAV